MGILSGIIGNSLMTMFQSLGINRYEGVSKAELIIRPLGPRGNPITLGGVGHLRLQYNPEVLNLPEYSAEYPAHRAVGMVRPVLHYTGSDLSEFPVDFVMVDDADGPPHALRTANGNLVYREFQDLFAVLQWLRYLTMPMKETETPPLVQFEWGPWSEIGVITKFASRVARSFPTGFPRIVEVNLNVRPEPVFSDKDTAYFAVK